MSDITPVSRLQATFVTYRLFGVFLFCEDCNRRQSVNDCRQPFPHAPGCAETGAEPHPWIVINTAVDWAMRRADPVPSAEPASTSGAST